MKSKYASKIWCYEVAKVIEEGKQARIARKKAEREEEKKKIPFKTLAQQRQDLIAENKAKGFFKGTIDEINSANQSKL